MENNLQRLFGNIDIYLFDQLLKGRFDACKQLIDVGCGGGRNLVYLLQNGFDVHGVDPNPDAIAAVRELAKTLAPHLSPANFKQATAEQLPFDAGCFDLIICSAVLHFARDRAHFEAMLFEMWRVLKPGGYFFARLATDIGLEDQTVALGNGRYLLPDGSERFLANEQMLIKYTIQLKGTLFEPLKTTNVQNLRCMSTWCLMK